MKLAKPEFEDGQWADNCTLLLRCPCCGGSNLHDTATTIYDRAEDDEWVQTTTVFYASLNSQLVHNDTSANPSPRRGGTTINFVCENCHGDNPTDRLEFILQIFQHKGSTYMRWDMQESA